MSLVGFVVTSLLGMAIGAASYVAMLLLGRQPMLGGVLLTYAGSLMVVALAAATDVPHPALNLVSWIAVGTLLTDTVASYIDRVPSASAHRCRACGQDRVIVYWLDWSGADGLQVLTPWASFCDACGRNMVRCDGSLSVAADMGKRPCAG